MDDLISRAAAIEAVYDERVDRNYGDVSPESVIGVIESIPAVDAAPVMYGHWIEDRTDIVCNVCGARYKDEIVFMSDVVYVNGLKYCPNCGAKMDGERRDEDAAD